MIDVRLYDIILSKERRIMEDKMFELMIKMYAEMKQGFVNVDSKFADIDNKFENIDNKLENLSRQVMSLENDLKPKVETALDGYSLVYEKLTELSENQIL